MPISSYAQTAASEPAAATSPAAATDDPALPKAMAQEENVQNSNTVVLQGLNKVTGHISKLDGPLGTTLRFGNLEIIPRRCWKSAPEDRPENAVLLEIRELKTGEASNRIFLGWMFSSSPGLSGLEHPVYDINVLACEYRADPEKIGSAADAAATTPADATAKPVKKKTKKKPVNQ